LFVGQDDDCSRQDNTIYVSSSANRVGINAVPLDTSTLLVGGTVAVSGNVNIRQNANFFQGYSTTNFFQGYSTTNSSVSLIGVNSSNVVEIGNLGFNISMEDDVDVSGELSASLGVTGSSLNTLNTVINSTHLSSSLNISGAAFYANGVELTSGGSPGGANTEIQFNADGAFGASPELSFLTSSNVLSGSGRATFEKVSIGEDVSTTPLYVKAPNDELVSVFKSATHDIILGVTGSNKVVVGGLHLDGVLNVTGSDVDKLISLKSDTHNPVFEVSGSGEVTINSTTPTITFSDSGTPAASIGLNSSDNLVIENNVTNKNIVFFVDDAGVQREGLRINGGVSEVVVNEGGDALVDFRVESDNNTHMLYVDGTNDRVGVNTSAPTHTLAVSGTMQVSGSFTAKTLEWTRTAFLYGGTSEIWIPFEGTGEATAPDWENQFVAPFNGELKRILIRPELAQNGNISASVWIATDTVPEIDAGTRVESAIGANSAVYTTTTIDFTGSNHFAAGDIVGVSITPRLNPGKINLTCIWQLDKTSF
jgi:hypothetical protein